MIWLALFEFIVIVVLWSRVVDLKADLIVEESARFECEQALNRMIRAREREEL